MCCNHIITFVRVYTRNSQTPFPLTLLIRLLYVQVELESRDDRGAVASGASGNSGLLDPPSTGILSHISAGSGNVAGTNSCGNDVKVDSQPTATTPSNSNNGVGGTPFQSSSSRSNHHTQSLPALVFDSSTQQFIDSMKYSDLTLSVESPGIASAVEIPCHKFMLAKKVLIVQLVD